MFNKFILRTCLHIVSSTYISLKIINFSQLLSFSYFIFLSPTYFLVTWQCEGIKLIFSKKIVIIFLLSIQTISLFYLLPGYNLFTLVGWYCIWGRTLTSNGTVSQNLRWCCCYDDLMVFAEGSFLFFLSLYFNFNKMFLQLLKAESIRMFMDLSVRSLANFYIFL